ARDDRRERVARRRCAQRIQGHAEREDRADLTAGEQRLMDRVQRRIGLVIGQLGYGGAEGQLYELVRALRDDARVGVYRLSDRSEAIRLMLDATGPCGPMLKQLGVAVRVMPARGSFDLGRVFALARAIRADRVELVHA